MRDQQPISPIVESIREFQEAAREFQRNPIEGCSPLCPGNCAHKQEAQIWNGRS
jgi:hypothetical protein